MNREEWIKEVLKFVEWCKNEYAKEPREFPISMENNLKRRKTMFISKSKLNVIEERLDDLEEFEKLFKESDLGTTLTKEYVACEICKCAIEKYNAIMGEGEIRIRQITEWVNYIPIMKDEEYIYHPYYCEIHKPRGSKEKC